MKKLIALSFLFVLPLISWAQDESSEEDSGPAYMMVQLTYILPEIGMEDEFEEAVLKHNEKYNSESSYSSQLWRVRSGEDAGWYIWTMGHMIYSDLDGSPGKGNHNDAWNKNVAPMISEYGHNENWVYKEDWSHSDGSRNDHEIVWFMDIEETEKDRFGAFMNKVGKLYREVDKPFMSWSGSFTSYGRDYALVIPFADYSWFDTSNWDIETDFDEMYGEGSWEMGMEMMDEIVVKQTDALWDRVK